MKSGYKIIFKKNFSAFYVQLSLKLKNLGSNKLYKCSSEASKKFPSK